MIAYPAGNWPWTVARISDDGEKETCRDGGEDGGGIDFKSEVDFGMKGAGSTYGDSAVPEGIRRR